MIPSMGHRVIEETQGRITPADFEDERHRLIYDAVTRAWNEGLTTDPATVHSIIRELGGPIASTIDLIDVRHIGANGVEEAAMSGPANWRSWVNRILRASVRRGVDHVGVMMQTGASSPADIEALIETAESEIAALRDRLAIKEPIAHVELVAQADARFRNPEAAAVSTRIVPTGYRRLDTALNGGVRGMTVIGSRTNMGKTLFSTNMHWRWARMGIKPLFFSAEDHRDEIADKMLAGATGMQIRGRSFDDLGKDEQAAYEEAVQALRDNATGWVEDTPRISVLEIARISRRYCDKYDVGAIVVDYLQLLRGHSRKGANRTEVVTDISRELKQLSGELGIPVVVNAQVGQWSEREGRPPRLTDLRETSTIADDANIVLLLHRPARDSETGFVHVAKQKGGRTGAVIPMHFLLDQQLVVESDEHISDAERDSLNRYDEAVRKAKEAPRV